MSRHVTLNKPIRGPDGSVNIVQRHRSSGITIESSTPTSWTWFSSRFGRIRARSTISFFGLLFLLLLVLNTARTATGSSQMTLQGYLEIMETVPNYTNIFNWNIIFYT